MESVFFDEVKVDKKRKEGLTLEESLDLTTIDKENSYAEFLIYQNGIPIREVILFEGGYIGRFNGATISHYGDMSVSEIHCKLISDGQQLYIVDNNSAYG